MQKYYQLLKYLFELLRARTSKSSSVEQPTGYMIQDGWFSKIVSYDDIQKSFAILQVFENIDGDF